MIIGKSNFRTLRVNKSLESESYKGKSINSNHLSSKKGKINNFNSENHRSTSIQSTSMISSTSVTTKSTSTVRVFTPTTEPATATYGTTYFDASENKIKIFTPDGWKTVKYE